MRYVERSVKISPLQLQKLRKSAVGKRGASLQLKGASLQGGDQTLHLTQQQDKKLAKCKEKSVGLVLKLSATQLQSMFRNNLLLRGGNILGALETATQIVKPIQDVLKLSAKEEAELKSGKSQGFFKDFAKGFRFGFSKPKEALKWIFGGKGLKVQHSKEFRHGVKSALGEMSGEGLFDVFKKGYFSDIAKYRALEQKSKDAYMKRLVDSGKLDALGGSGVRIL